eukprot:3384468-Amphidinium_carterae.2
MGVRRHSDPFHADTRPIGLDHLLEGDAATCVRHAPGVRFIRKSRLFVIACASAWRCIDGLVTTRCTALKAT